MGNFMDNWVKKALPAHRKQQARAQRELRARVWTCPNCQIEFKPPQVNRVPEYPICPKCGRDCDVEPEHIL